VIRRLPANVNNPGPVSRPDGGPCAPNDAEEKRSGTIELAPDLARDRFPESSGEVCLGANGRSNGPLHGWPVTRLMHSAPAGRHGHPRWKAGSLTTTPGCCCSAACSWPAVGLFISPARRIRSSPGMVTLRGVFRLLWIITGIGSFSGPTVDKRSRSTTLTAPGGRLAPGRGMTPVLSFGQSFRRCRSFCFPF